MQQEKTMLAEGTAISRGILLEKKLQGQKDLTIVHPGREYAAHCQCSLPVLPYNTSNTAQAQPKTSRQRDDIL